MFFIGKMCKAWFVKKDVRNTYDIFYVDPMSYNNLEIYDSKLLGNIKLKKIRFYGNKKIKRNIKTAKLIYDYSGKKGIAKGLSYILSQIVLFKDILAYKPKLVHFQWFKLPYFDYLLLKVLKFININIVFTAHNILPHDTGMRYYKIYSKIYKICDAIIVHCDRTKKELISMFALSEDKIKVIPHGVLEMDCKAFTAKEAREIMIKLDSSKVKIAFMGNITKYKGIDYLVKAWESYSDENENIQLIIAGKGSLPDEEYLKSDPNVLLYNRFLTDEEFCALLRVVDVIVMPYRKISQSGVLLSAISEEKLVVVSDVGGLSEPFYLFGLGWIIKNDPIGELVEIFRQINSNPELVAEKRPSEKEWRRIRDYYSWEKIGETTERLYAKVVEE